MVQLPMQSMPNATKVVSLNLSYGGVCSNTTFCDKVCQRLPTGRWFSQGTLISSMNKSNRHDVIEILLKVALNIISQTLQIVTCCVWLTALSVTQKSSQSFWSCQWHIKRKNYQIIQKN